MVWLLRALAFFWIGLAVLPAAAFELIHDWPVMERGADVVTLTAQGSARGRGLTATIREPLELKGTNAAEAFDAEIERQLADEVTIIERTDMPRIPIGEKMTLFTQLDIKAGRAETPAIVYFSAYADTSVDQLRIVRADGPNDRALMEHFFSDVLALAKDPVGAIAGTIKLAPHPGKRIAPKRANPTTAVAKRKTKKSSKDESLSTPHRWTRKTYSDAASYTPSFGKLAPGGKPGFFSVTVYKPRPLDGRSLDVALTDFVKSKEKHYEKIRSREPALLDGPYRAWDFLQWENKHGAVLNTGYIAFKSENDKMTIVRETLTDGDEVNRFDYGRGIDAIYAHVTAKLPDRYHDGTRAATTMQLMFRKLQNETASERQKRHKATADASKEHLRGRAKSAPGKGIQMADLHAVFLRKDFLDRAYKGRNANVGIYVLLKDGTAYSNPARPPSDLDVVASRKLESSRWMSWRKVGKTYQVRSNSGEAWKLLQGQLAKPAPREQLNFQGEHIAVWGDLLMGTAGHRSGNIALTRKGRYETSSFALSGGSGITGIPSAHVSASAGKNGRQSTVSSDVAPVLLNNVKRDPNGTDFTGQYALDGFTAEFLSDSGKLRRSLFLMTKDGIYVGDRYYSRKN